MNLSFFAAILLASSILFSTQPKAELLKIQPASEKEMAPIRAKLKGEEFSHLHGPRYGTGYLIDINNDGKQEYVFVTEEGNMHCLNIEVFVEDEKGIHYLEMPHKPSSIGFFERNESELFIQAQGKVYICTTNDYRFHRTRDIHIWESNKMSFACDPFWMQQQRKIFTDLCQKARYHDAFVFLKEFEENCRHLIDPQMDLSLRKDVAIVALKDDCPNTGLKILDALVVDTAYAQASLDLKKAVKNTKALCRKALENECTKGKYDYRWVLLDAKNSPNTIMCDKEEQFDTLLNAVVPDVKPFCFQNSQETWKTTLKSYFAGLMYGGKVVIDDRYVICTGSVDHCCCSRAFLWCDIKEKVSAIVSFGDYRTDNLIITSRSLDQNELPPEFYQSLRDWLSSQGREEKTIQALFYDRCGNVYPLQF